MVMCTWDSAKIDRIRTEVKHVYILNITNNRIRSNDIKLNFEKGQSCGIFHYCKCIGPKLLLALFMHSFWHQCWTLSMERMEKSLLTIVRAEGYILCLFTSKIKRDREQVMGRQRMEQRIFALNRNLAQKLIDGSPLFAHVRNQPRLLLLLPIIYYSEYNISIMNRKWARCIYIAKHAFSSDCTCRVSTPI